jgi:hypothetical protein
MLLRHLDFTTLRLGFPYFPVKKFPGKREIQAKSREIPGIPGNSRDAFIEVKYTLNILISKLSETPFSYI